MAHPRSWVSWHKQRLGTQGKVALLPEGEATIDRVAGLSLESSGRKKNVTLYAIAGLDFAPTYVWLDERRSFFAQLDPWHTVIPEGWEATVKPLQAAQDKAADARAAQLASKLATRRPSGIVFTHVNSSMPSRQRF